MPFFFCLYDGLLSLKCGKNGGGVFDGGNGMNEGETFFDNDLDIERERLGLMLLLNDLLMDLDTEGDADLEKDFEKDFEIEGLMLLLNDLLMDLDTEGDADLEILLLTLLDTALLEMMLLYPGVLDGLIAGYCLAETS